MVSDLSRIRVSADECRRRYPGKLRYGVAVISMSDKGGGGPGGLPGACACAPLSAIKHSNAAARPRPSQSRERRYRDAAVSGKDDILSLSGRKTCGRIRALSLRRRSTNGYSVSAKIAPAAGSRGISLDWRRPPVADPTAAVDRPIKRTAKVEVGDAVDILPDRAVGQCPGRRADRRRDHLIATADRCVECTAAIEIGGSAKINR